MITDENVTEIREELKELLSISLNYGAGLNNSTTELTEKMYRLGVSRAISLINERNE